MDYGILIGESVEIDSTAAATVSLAKVSAAAMRSCQRVTSSVKESPPKVFCVVCYKSMKKSRDSWTSARVPVR
jgi:hypothetical protein